MKTEELQKLDREHVIYSWKAQGGWKPTVIDHAEGVYMYDTDGKKILDGSGPLQLADLDLIPGIAGVGISGQGQVDALTQGYVPGRGRRRLE